MAVDFYFEDVLVSKAAGGGYLHFFAENSDVDPGNVYQQVANARNRISSNALQEATSIIGRNMSAPIGKLSEANKIVINNLLTGKIFEDMSPSDVAGEAKEIPEGTDSLLDAINDVVSDTNRRVSTAYDFTVKIREIIQKILDAKNIDMVAKDYCQQVFQEYVSSGYMSSGGRITSIEEKIVRAIMEKNNGKFFAVENRLGVTENLNRRIAEMAALAEAAPTLSQSRNITNNPYKGDNITKIINKKLDEFMNFLSETASQLASAIGAADVLNQAYTDSINSTNRAAKGQSSAVQLDSKLSEDQRRIQGLINQTLGRRYNSNTYNFTVNKDGVTANVALITQTPSSIGAITPNTTQRTFNIVEDTTFLTVLARHAGVEGQTLYELMQMLTYHDANGSSKEFAAEQSWNLILELVPYLALINRLTYAFVDGANYANTFYSLGGKIWPASEVLSHIAKTLTRNSGLTGSFVTMSGANFDRSNFVNSNQFIASYSRQGSRDTPGPDTEAAIERSKTLRARVYSQLIAMRINIKVRLAQLAALTASSWV